MTDELTDEPNYDDPAYWAEQGTSYRDQKSWEKGAACAKAIEENKYLQVIWFSDAEEDGQMEWQDKKAVEICESCPVARLCLQNALMDEEAYGWRGGVWFESGRLPVAKARELQKAGYKIGSHQSTGRASSKRAWPFPEDEYGEKSQSKYV